ncbi:helix-turn-helix domain-containing protein [Microbaculum marinum]|uniref:Helix-turn-helix domain-containing protein n=1 Tax=Microbaculum marinum TaxID=1764581 RepID=A0AAW9RYR7_9HYPH
MDLARNPRQLGSIIRRARKRLGWNQSQLGAKAGVGQDTISLLETGNSSANLQTIFAVLAALDLEIRIAPRSKGTAADIEKLF